MKKIHYILTVLAILNLLSCSDYLDVSPRNKLADDTFWKTEDDAISACTGVYSGLKYTSVLENIILNASTFSDEGTVPWPEDPTLVIGSGSYDPASTFMYTQWTETYMIIRLANVFLANISQPDMDEDLRNRLTGEVRFIRAYMYHFLYIMWGGVPLVTEPLSISQLKIKRSTAGEIVQFIINELDLALEEGLPDSYTGEDIGRVTKGAVLALKTRMLLYAEQWDDAAATAKSIMDMPVYSLFKDESNVARSYEALFDKVNENNSEIIFDVQYLLELNFNVCQTYNLPPSIGGWGGMCPFQQTVDAFECTDGKTIDESPLYDPEDPFANRDPRLDMAILHNGSNFLGYTINTNSGADSPFGYGNNSPTGYYTRKLDDDSYPVELGQINWDCNIIHMRYAEVLLSYAEAKVESNNIDQSVLDAINSIRARAYGVDITDTDNYPEITTTDQTELRKIVRRERRVELCFEGIRRYDIRRWKIAEDVLNEPGYGYVNGENFVVINRTFDASKNYVWPIPQTEIDLMGADILEQNPGY